MAKEKTLQDLFHDTLKDIYFAEKKILTALPKMAKAARSAELRRRSRSITPRPKGGSSVSSACSREIGEEPRGKTCDAIMGLVEEGQEIMKGYKSSPALDAGLLAAAQSKTWPASSG
jgi:ferritin-like metal-binding protein YciE